MDDWFLITTYKDNFNFMETFVNFYSSLWGINKFFLLIGVTKKTEMGVIMKRINDLSYNLKVNIECMSVSTEELVTEDEWGIQKELYFLQIDQRVDTKYKRVLNIDNDEFYYIHDKDIIRKNNSLHFHFLEYIPKEVFNINDDFEWSAQGWFYRVNSFSTRQHSEVSKEIRENEYLKLQSNLSEQTNKIKVAVTHQWCKLVRFERRYLVKDPWEHLDNGVKCNEIKEARTME